MASPNAAPDARILVLGGDGALAASLRALGLRADSAPDLMAALHAIISADVAMDPYALVIGSSIELGESLARAPLLAAPRLLDPGALAPDALDEAVAFAIASVRADPPILLQGVDTAVGLNHVGGDRAFYIKLLERFWRSHQGTAESMRGDAVAGNWSDAARRAHTLRGSAASVGAEELRQAAEALEHAVGHERAAPAEMAALFPVLGRVMAGLEEFFSSQHDPCQISLLNRAQALAARAELIVLLDDFSGDTLDHFEEARASLAQLLTPQALQALAGHLERYEFEAARAVLDEGLSKSE